MASTRLEQYISFQYPITRPFNHRWKYANWFLLAFGVLCFVGLSALNFDLVGYEIVSTSSENFNMTESLSWLEQWKTGADGCQTHMFQLGDTFMTNTSAFMYTITNIGVQNNSVQGSFVYANNTLRDCDVTEILATVSPGDRSIEVEVNPVLAPYSWAAIECPDIGFEASTSYTFTNHAMIGVISPDSFAYNSFARAILNQMYAFGNDAYNPIYVGLYVSSGTALFKVLADFTPICESSNATTCDEAAVEWTLEWYNAISQSSLAIVANQGNYPSNVNASIDTLVNFVQVFYAAIRLDLGHWTPNNIFTNATAINSTIVIPIVPANSAASIARSSTVGLAYLNLTSPPSADVSSPPAVMNLQYICNTTRLKAPGTLIISVATATLSMFITAWAILTTGMAIVAKRRDGANTCAACGNGVGTRRSSYGRDSSYSSKGYDPVELGPASSTQKKLDTFELPVYGEGEPVKTKYGSEGTSVTDSEML